MRNLHRMSGDTGEPGRRLHSPYLLTANIYLYGLTLIRWYKR